MSMGNMEMELVYVNFTSIPFLGVHLFVLMFFILFCSKFISFMVCF